MAVVPKFNLLNIPGQTPASSPVSGSGAGPTPGAALPVVVGLPVRMQNGTAVFLKNNIDDALANKTHEAVVGSGKRPGEGTFVHNSKPGVCVSLL